jgi:hypothetical protein
MMNITKGFSNRSIAMNETLYATDSKYLSIHGKKAVERKQGNKIELHFHMIGEFIDFYYSYYVGCNKSTCLLI